MVQVYCRECRQKVADCPHFVFPIQAPRLPVFDPKIETLAYDEKQRILEITFKTGQVWQLFDVPANIFAEIRDTSISSFLKFIAQRYKSAPVKTGLNAVRVPESEPCQTCKKPMALKHRINNEFDVNVRVLWKCAECDDHLWMQYGFGFRRRERKGRWH
jgi:hypothetical protein